MSSLGGYSPQISGSGYSPADFLDAEETQPTEIYLDPTGTGTLTPYSTAVNNALHRSLQETRQANPHPNIVSDNWKKKYRDFLNNKNEDLVGFLAKKLPEMTSYSRVQHFLRKYGKPDALQRNSAIRDRFLDVSGSPPYMEALNLELQTHGKSSYPELVQQVKYLMEQYKETGEKVLQTDTLLRTKMDALDRSVHKVTGFGELRQNQAFHGLMDAVQVYLNALFEENRIEETFQELLQHYKKLQFLRESIQFLWSFEASQRESLCAICFSDPIQYALVPCGHTYCVNCVKHQMMTCSMCRSSIREKIKLYIG